MSANNYNGAQALSASPGSQLAALQARQYESETTQRMMTKFDEAVMAMTAGITDPTELQAPFYFVWGSGRCRHLPTPSGVKPPLPLLTTPKGS